MPEEMRVEAMELCVTACEKYATNNEVLAKSQNGQLQLLQLREPAGAGLRVQGRVQSDPDILLLSLCTEQG